MIYNIEITDQANHDIRSIYEYIAYELLSPTNASGQLDRIQKCIMSLDYMPERYRFLIENRGEVVGFILFEWIATVSFSKRRWRLSASGSS